MHWFLSDISILDLIWRHVFGCQSIFLVTIVIQFCDTSNCFTLFMFNYSLPFGGRQWIVKQTFFFLTQILFFLCQNLSNFSGGTFWNSNLIFIVNINFFHSVIRGRLYYEMEQGSPVWIVALQFTRVQIMLNNFQMISKVIRMRYHYFSIYITFNAIINFHLLNIDFKTRVNTKYFILVYITLTCINLQNANSFIFLLNFSLNKT